MQESNVNQGGCLYIVATPIGHLADFSFRAVDILQQVDLIAAEDTRHARPLLQHYGITTPLVSFHQHNEEKQAPGLLEKIKQGMSVALISDAGTPLLSDPGMPLVKMAREQEITVSPIPGACALIAALSVAGLPMTRFRFEGFLPRTSGARRQFFAEMLNVEQTWAFYESSHRILSAMTDMLEVLPAERECVVARELTKMHETIVKGSLAAIVEKITNNPMMRKGEFVVVVAGSDKIDSDESGEDAKELLKILLEECSVKTAANLAAKITGLRKKNLYQMALELTKNK
jgi:16S rRNA (cytidine1402-2'-O)-methyltransferase